MRGHCKQTIIVGRSFVLNFLAGTSDEIGGESMLISKPFD